LADVLTFVLTFVATAITSAIAIAAIEVAGVTSAIAIPRLVEIPDFLKKSGI